MQRPTNHPSVRPSVHLYIYPFIQQRVANIATFYMTTESEQLPYETLPKHRQPYRYTGDAMIRSLVKEIGTKVKHNIINVTNR